MTRQPLIEKQKRYASLSAEMALEPRLRHNRRLARVALANQRR